MASVPRHPSYCSLNGVLFDVSKSTLIQFPEGLGGSYEIPNTVFNIGDYAFYYCGNLNKVVISASVTSIGRHAFDTCYNLATLDFGSGVTNIGDSAFMGCGSLTNVTIGSGVINIGANAFHYCNGLTNITIPNSVINIGSNAFFGCFKLAHVSLGNGVTSIGDSAFFECDDLTGVTIPNNVTNIGDSAFADCNLTSITIPNSVIHIGDFAFFACYGLTNVIIDNSAVSIEEDAFIYCVNLAGIYFKGDAPPPNGYVFDSGYLFTYVTVYYLPGTIGWGPTFGGLATKPWMLPYPLILNDEPTFGVKGNQFSFTISWATNLPVVVEICTNLASPAWTSVSTNALVNGTNYFSDTRWTNSSARFYRLRSP
jgi:BspA type Leucine rich repeat region (6 copies)